MKTVVFCPRALLPPANEVFEGYVFTPVCQSFCSQEGEYLGRYPPSQVHPPARYLLGRYSPWAGTPPRQVPLTPWAGTPPQAGTPLQAGTPSWAGTPPPLGRYTPRAGYTPANACWDTVNKWAVRILLECILVRYCFES